MRTIDSIANGIDRYVETGKYGRFVTWIPALLVGAAAIQVVSLLWGVNWFESHEREMYPVRLVEYVQTFKCGLSFPRWCPDLYGGYGYPLFNYYQPGVFAAAAAIMALLAVPPIAALRLTIALFAVAGGYGVYRLALGETGRRDAALLAGIVFVYLPYRFTDLFIRGDLSEFAAYSVIPFVFWGARELNRANRDRVSFVGTLTTFCLAATLFCHILVGLYTIEILGFMLFTILLRRNVQKVFIIGCAIVLSIGVAAVYIGPAWFERGLVSFDNLRAPTWYPTNNLILPWRAIFDSGWCSIGLAPVVGAAIAAMSFVLSRARRNAAIILGWWLPAILIVPLLLKAGWTEWFWNHLPLGSFIQFPWRLLGFIGFFASIGIAVIWAIIVPDRFRVFRWSGAILFSLVIAFIEQPYRTFAYGAWDVPDPLMTPRGIRNQAIDPVQNTPYTTVVNNEYLPVTAKSFDARNLADLVPLVSWADGPQTVLAKNSLPSEPWKVGKRPHGLKQAPILSQDHALIISNTASIQYTQPCPLVYVIDARAATPRNLRLRVFDFPGWKIDTLSGPAKVQHQTSNDGVIQLYLPIPGTYKVKVYFGLTSFRAIVSVITILALLLTYPVFLGLSHIFTIEPESSIEDCSVSM